MHWRFTGMVTVRLDTASITDWDSFHTTFAGLMGFPDYYGRNMNAWIDCMTYLDEGDLGMTHFSLSPGQIFGIEIPETEAFMQRVPELAEALISRTAFVNLRYMERVGKPVIALLFL
jgi:hypothetical protein